MSEDTGVATLGSAAAELSVHWVVGLQQHRQQGRSVRCDMLAAWRLSHGLLFVPLLRSYRHVHSQLPAFPRDTWMLMSFTLTPASAG